MPFFCIFFFPLMIWGSGLIVFWYDPHRYDGYKYGKLFSQHGLNLNLPFIKLKDEQWPEFKEYARHYYNISAVISVIFCVIVSLIWYDDFQFVMTLETLHMVVIETTVILLAYSRTKGHDDAPKML